MIEQLLQDYLSQALDVPCLLSVPEDPPDLFCVLEKTGSDYKDGLFQATMAIQSYGPGGAHKGGQWKASQLNRRVVLALLDADTLPEIAHCDLHTDYNFPDTARKRPRYQAVFDFTYYE